MTDKHTRWVVCDHPVLRSSFSVVETKDKPGFAVVKGRTLAEGLSWEQARLIAAAPDLLEALEEIAGQMKTDELDTEYDVECADFEGGYDACIDTARAAIRKARGQRDG